VRDSRVRGIVYYTQASALEKHKSWSIPKTADYRRGGGMSGIKQNGEKGEE
jgi:hypothetical protein